jgi:hypothetical protein
MRGSRRWWRVVATLFAVVGLSTQAANASSAATCDRHEASRGVDVTAHGVVAHSHDTDAPASTPEQDSQGHHQRCDEAAMCGVPMVAEPGLPWWAPEGIVGAAFPSVQQWASVSVVPDLPPPRV